ncbi:hypothetical protein GH865_05180 [Rhodocyclus tenuis]|uniref:hypothetical protein n=1 Tax=Rhodocyclus gracilis TaxID=2929842 RepID=UPI001298B36C|nr:hypothetical protein [Rhodocyclus gracilis]MRD72643.1 hypothetical protein [Rhodocyclus gracilis]
MALALLAGAVGVGVGPAAAHGSAPGHARPEQSAQGIERGLDLAHNCDHAIHELLDEYAACLRSNQIEIGADAAAETAFRFFAWLRAANAAYQGYPDGETVQLRFRQEYLAAARRHPVPPEELCRALGLDCAQLPVAPPRLAEIGG